jgi:XTP/dITP diphosphohydrolase
VKPEAFVLATRSQDKVRELSDLFRGSGHSIVTLEELGVEPLPEEDSLEDADTFEENALAKARYFAKRIGRAVLADDSGLEVTALGGRPGVVSKRWSGRSDLSGKRLDEANNARLLAELSGVRDRGARYVCAAALWAEGTERTCRGTAAGIILEEPRGSNGFGYDPYFFSEELRKTFGEASLEEKQSVSHRARAFRALIRALDKYS